MRILKFRAWIKLGENDWRMSKIRWINLDNGSVCTETGLQPDEAIIMQYTGLKDKNGKEIYEADIYKFYSPRFQQEFVEVIEWPFDWTMLDCPGEVIGNIYENPELLERGIKDE